MIAYELLIIFVFKQKTAYEMRISDWSSDVCSSDLPRFMLPRAHTRTRRPHRTRRTAWRWRGWGSGLRWWMDAAHRDAATHFAIRAFRDLPRRSEEHTSELQSLMRISYAVFCLKKKK